MGLFTTLPHNYVGGGHQVITIADSVISLFANALTLIQPTSGTFIGKQASGVVITVITNPIYYTFDSTSPATNGSAGHPLDVGSQLVVYGWDNVKRLKFIRQGSNTGAIVVTPLFTTATVAVPNLS